MIATWYVMSDGSVADPSDVSPDAKGVLKHKDGRVVAMRGDVPRSRSVDVERLAKDVGSGRKTPNQARAELNLQPAKDMRPQQTGGGYLTRDGASSSDNPFDHDRDGRPGGAMKPADSDGDLSALRSEYQTVFGKKAFAGWDAATLREKIAAKAD